MELKQIEPQKIKVAKYNPSQRVIKNLLGLTESIKTFGIIEPLIITDNLELVDGHRRLAVTKTLKLKTVPCVLRNGTTEQLKDILYLDVNQHKWKISGADQVEIYKKGGKIEQRFLNPLLSLIAITGNGIVDVLLKHRQNPNNIYHTFIQLKKYCNLKNDKEAILWICNTRSSYAVRRAIEASVKPSIFIKAIRGNKNLKHIWVVSPFTKLT